MPENQCTVCHIGLLHLRRVTYTRMMDHHLLILPNMAVWLCDVCGEFSYDPEAMRRLHMLLGMTASASAAERRPGARPETDDQSSRLSGRRGSA